MSAPDLTWGHDVRTPKTLGGQVRGDEGGLMNNDQLNSS